SRLYRDPRRRGEKKRTNPTTQAPKWYSHAIFTAMCLQHRNSDATVAVALPDMSRYRTMHAETAASLTKLNLTMLLVDEYGYVDRLGPLSSPDVGNKTIHLLSKVDVEGCHSACGVGRQPHVDLVVDIGPFGMMVHFLRGKRASGHEGKCLTEVLEFELPANCLSIFLQVPAVELQQRGLDLRALQFRPAHKNLLRASSA